MQIPSGCGGYSRWSRMIRSHPPHLLKSVGNYLSKVRLFLIEQVPVKIQRFINDKSSIRLDIFEKTGGRRFVTLAIPNVTHHGERFMKAKQILILSALVLAFTSIATAQDKQPADAPKLVMDSFQHDFGEIKAGTALNYTFIVKNQGKANLEIKSVAPS